MTAPNPKALELAIKSVNKTPMINSISLEPARLEGVLPIVAAHKCPAVALAMDEKGIPKTKEERISIIGRMLEKTRSLGIPDGNLYFDPLAMTIATGNENGLVFFDTIREIRKQFPEVHMTCGLSNISFGMPARSFIDRVFLAYAMEAGRIAPFAIRTIRTSKPPCWQPSFCWEMTSIASNLLARFAREFLTSSIPFKKAFVFCIIEQQLPKGSKKESICRKN